MSQQPPPQQQQMQKQFQMQQNVVQQSSVSQTTSGTVNMQQSNVQQSSMQQTSMQQTSIRQQSQQQQSRVVREVHQGMQQISGQQMMPVGLPPGASPPVFEQIFRNARFAQGGDALFEGKVVGNPNPTISWMRKGQQLQHGIKYQVTHNEQTGVVTLQICAIGPGDEGEYTCTASNQYGEAICTVYIQPEVAHMIQQQREQQQQMLQSSKQTFMQQQQMQQTTQQQQHLQMMQNSHVQSSFRVDTFEYRILHEVEYRQSLTPLLAGEVDPSRAAPLQGPPQAPQVQQKPRATKVAEGNNATFTVKISANPNPRINWFKNGERLTASDKYQMTYSAGIGTIVVKNVDASDSGYYTMLAENPSGCTITSGQLAVVAKASNLTNGLQTKVTRSEQIETHQEMHMEVDTGEETGKSLEPKFTSIPPHQTVQEGKMVRFDCRATGRPYPEVTWLLNGQPIANDATHKMLVNEQGNHSLMITQSSLGDAGVISCIARNKMGETSFQVQLNVLEREQLVAPKFVERFQQGQVQEGETAQLNVRAVGTPCPTLQWSKDGATVVLSENVQIQSDGGSSILQILSTSPADAGWYQCTAQNVAGSTATRARLHVQANKPTAPAEAPRPVFPKPVKVIEPEKEPEPEVIYLRHVERARQQVKGPEEEQPTEAPKFTHFVRDIEVEENKRAHFEARVIPLGDATMCVEWLIDGRPLPASSRVTVTYRFGYVALDILNVIEADAAVYTCRATNVIGEAETSAHLRVVEKPQIESGTQHPEAMQQISYLEDSSRNDRNVIVDEESSAKPTFIRPLSNLGDLVEGKYAHFEAQLHPVSDPFMKIEWFKDGKSITASSRINVIYNFGYVALTIMHIRQEDTGIYTVRATNRAGECVCQASMRVINLSGVTAELGIPEQAQYIKSVEEMEAYRLQMQQKTQQEILEASSAPVFKTNFKSANAKEGGYAHMEARLEPVGDPTLKVEWLKDGRPIEASSRITSFFNFGYVALTIKALIVRDAGTYTCRAFNTKGEATNTATLVVVSKTDIEGDSQYNETAMKMQFLEDNARKQRTETQETTISNMPPKFLGPMKGTTKIVEGQRAHFECRLEPQNDSSMIVEWYFNGQVLMSASRMKFYNDFGYVALDISDVRSADTGTYTVVARNSMGEAQMSATMEVETRSTIDYSTMHEVTMKQTAAMEHRHQEPLYQVEDYTKSKPVFTQLLQDVPQTQEGKNVHLEGRLEPIGDPTLQVEWYFNGKPITVGSRFKTYFDFGYVALDIIGTYASDSGEYTCRAVNRLGEAHTSACIRISGTEGIETDTMNDAAMEQIQFLESERGQKLLQDDMDINQPPTFSKSLKNIETIEGANIHLEARLQPIGDSSMRVEWYFNDQPLKVGHRFKPAYDFDYVALDLLQVYPVDSGIYTCRATNRMGEAVASASVKVHESSSIIMESQTETMTTEQIRLLEERRKYMRTEVMDETTQQAPVFTTSLKNIEILENQRAHFEVRLIPASDPTMKVEWFFNNQKVKSGSRFTEYNDFGFVALDIMQATADDSGTYNTVATNALGQAITSATLVVHTKDSILLDTMNQEAMSKISRLESRSQRALTTDEMSFQAPVFTSPIKDVQLTENTPLHFEARLIPVGDPDLRVEWFKNGIPLQPANRISTMHDFGYVALDMKYVNPDDSGTYTCRATNKLGQAVSSASLTVVSKQSLLTESQHGDALEKLRYLEDSSKYSKSSTEETVITQAPKFVVALSGLTQLWEGQSAHVEGRLEPYPDPTMKVEWFHNGQPLLVGHRFRTIYDFGFVAMDILSAMASDSGTYEVRATNRLGTSSSIIDITVKPKSDFIIESQHPDAIAKIRRLEQKGVSKIEDEQLVIDKPNFGRALRNQQNLIEGQAVHMEATLTPVNDPTMKVEWLYNGAPIPTGHRFRTTYDFGFVALDILYAYPEDSGTYMCRASNAAGQAVTSCSIRIEESDGMQVDGVEDRMKKIRMLEASTKMEVDVQETGPMKPIFTTALQSQDNIAEGERVHLECRLEPINDPHLKVEWYVNGIEIMQGHRFRTTHDFGYVALDILYAYNEDSGNYICKAYNKVGEAVNSCSVTVSARRAIYMDTQHPVGWEQIQNLEHKTRYERLEVADLPNMAPKFTSELRGKTKLGEGVRAHIEGRIEPIHDPSMRIEWYKNGKIIPSAARFHTTFDFGYVAFDLTSVYAEDSGEYTCRAFNNLGEARSTIVIQISGSGNIINESARPEGLDKIRELEDSTKMDVQVVEDLRTFQRPVFTQPLQNLENSNEGETAHFECRLIPVGDPKLRVEWYRNEMPVETSSRINQTHDFGYVALDIMGVRTEDEGIYMCRAMNELGEAVTTASMKISSHANIQLDTHHPEGMKKIQALEERKPSGISAEPDKTFDKPVFTVVLTGPETLMEGARAHYQCRIIPVGDPTMRVEWYCNGVALSLGSRFHTTHDFGFVTLDILQTITKDSGVYMCKAINKVGEAVSSCSTRIIGRDGVVGEAVHPEGWAAIKLRETQWNRVPQTPMSPETEEPPVFTKHFESFDRLQEGGSISLEGQVQPSNDPNLSIEWFKNGVQLSTGTRFRSTFDFGHVLLHIAGLRENDSGIYTCKAVNRVGEAISTCTLKVHDRDWLIGDSVRPEALPKLARFDEPKSAGRGQEPETIYDLPVFISHLNDVENREGDNAHFECKVEPSKDPTMKIEWFINGKSMQAASRYQAKYDFGFVSLDCTHCYAEDSGIYTCKATNSKGSASTTGTLKCISKANLNLDTQHPQGVVGLEKVEEAERAFFNKVQRAVMDVDATFPKPYFIRPLEPNFHIIENQALHMEANVEPKNDPDLKIEWFLNGKPLEQGSRFKSSYDFGLVTLDLNDCYERDQGIYTCKAFNKYGEAFCTTTVVVSPKGTLIEGTQHPAGDAGLEAIQRMEESLRRSDRMLPDEEGHPPVFTTTFKSLSNVEETEIAHFEALLTPVGDETMRVEWFYNGEALKASHRVRTVYAFGMVVLEIVGTKVPDSGEYTCKAKNKWGRAECSCTLEVVDRAHGQPPKFTTQIVSLENVKDGQAGHFECTLIPIGDPNMKVEWFHNGQPLRNATRIKTVNDFGFVVLDVAYLRNHDTGEWVCKASNKYGEDFTKAFINCTGKGGVYTDSLQPGSLDKIAELEAHKKSAQDMVSPQAAEPPKFITQIVNIEHLAEGQSAHFEARLKPIGDPNLLVEWYKDGKKLTTKHRYRTFHDFGIVILDILYCYEEDSGVYEARAVNKLGKDETSANLKCSSKAGLILSPQVPKGMEGGLDKIQQLEDTAWIRRQSIASDRAGMPPTFTVPLSNIDGLKEGENAHFEAKLIPTDDPRLKLEWYYNGKPMKHSSRIRQFCDFGFVIMEIGTVYSEDSGEYMCRAFNDYGEAVTKCVLKCEGRRNIIFDTQLPKSMQKGMEKIAVLEGLMIKSPDDFSSSDSGQPPQFVTQPSNVSIKENQLAHFECRLLPVGDPTMRVEWYHNGKPLSVGTRIKTINDFGYVILEISGCYARDSGTYTCRAVNNFGQANVECSMVVSSKSGIILDPQATGHFKDCTESILKLEENKFKKEDQQTLDNEKPCPPKFVTNLENVSDLIEGQPAHFDCRVEPVGDSTMRIEWFHNGSQIGAGSRVHMMDDFGFVVLDLEWTFSRDCGEYVCRATNKWGQATTKATLMIKSKHGVDMSTQLPLGMTAEKLKELERGPLSEKIEADEELKPPKFTVPLKNIAIEEGEKATFEADVEPRTDPNLVIEWYFNGKPLQSGHRFKTTYEMGHVTLQLLYTYTEDSGEYVCRAVNKLGQDVTKASLKSKVASLVISQSQALKGVKSKDIVTQMEETLKKYNVKDIMLTAEDIYDLEKKQPPRFVTHIQDNSKLEELQDNKFDCQLTPVGDPNMKVEWFFNGRPLPYKTRFTPIYDFGYVALNMGWVYGADSGEYLCRATNLYGMDETRATIKVAGRPGVIYDSQVPKGMQSLEKIRDLEASWHIVPSQQVEEEKIRSKPEILKKPESIEVQEGGWGRFSIRVAGYPKPRVMWIVNGSTAISGNRFKIWYDGMFHLDIPKTRQYDDGKIEVICRNSLGEAYSSCELKVKPRQDDYRAVLKNSPKPWYDYEIKGYQDERMDGELARVFEERIDGENAIIHSSQFGEYVAKPINYAEETEWQRVAREKNAGAKIKELEDESRLRSRSKDTRMFALPAVHAQQKSLAKGMASEYEASIVGTDQPENVDVVKESREAQIARANQRQEQLIEQRKRTEEERRQEMIRKQQEQQNFLKSQKNEELLQRELEPTESSVHGKEIHTTVQKQTQKEIQGDLEIHRKITATERTEMEHKGKTTERIVQGPVQPSNPPFFTNKIRPCRAYEKDSARFEVEFDGDPRPSVQWYREDFPITNSTDFQIHTFGEKSILIIREVFLEDSGVFAVVAENRGGRAKCSANLVVEEKKQSRASIVPPSFTSTIQDLKAEPGVLVRLDAKIHGTSPIDVYWLKDGSKVNQDSKRKFVVDDEDYTIMILEATPEDSGSYECVAINKAGEARCQADVLISGAKATASPKVKASTDKRAPEIIEKLKGLIVNEGQAAKFECLISASPVCQVTWLKNDQPIKQSKYFTMSSDNNGLYALKISESFPEDEGTYKCVLKNPVGQVTLIAPLKVIQPQQRSVPPTLTNIESQTVFEGDSVKMVTEVGGTPAPKVNWYREGTLIPVSPDFEMSVDGNKAILTIGETYPEDTGRFTCRATNNAGQAETSAIITVKRSEDEKPRGEAPLFYEVLKPIKVKHGEKATLTANVRAQPIPKIIWYHGEKELPVNEDFLQQYEESTGNLKLTIKEVFIDDRGLYKAIAINQFGKDETTGYLTVEDLEILEKTELRQAPRIIIPVQAQVLPLGSAVVLKAEYEAFPPPTIKWYKDLREIKHSTEFIIKNTNDETTLSIDELYEDDHGEYQVRIFNEAGEARSAATVVVIHSKQIIDSKPPKFIQSLAPQTIPEHEIVILEAEVDAKPDAIFKWFRHGEELHTDEDLEIKITSLNNKSTLVIGELYEEDSGDYTVSAENRVGKASSTATLLVEGAEDDITEEFNPPEFNPQLTPVRVMDGERVKFTCKVHGQPTPKISWFHNGFPIADHREVKVMQTPDGRVGLLISEVFPEDSGDYTCIARNKVGEARTTACLAVESFEYHPDSEVSTIASFSDKQIISGTASEDEILDIEKDSDADSEAGSSPYFVNRLNRVVEVRESSSVRLIAKVSGFPKPNTAWYIDDQPLDNSEQYNVEDFEDGTVGLNIPYVILEHCGVYICEAMNRNGIDTTYTQLVVFPQEHSETTGTNYRKPDWVTRMECLRDSIQGQKVSPVFLQDAVNGRVKEMDSHTFLVIFKGNPKPEINWYCNDKLLPQNQTYQMRVRGDKAMLTVVKVSPHNKGNYACRAVNSEGELFSRASLEIIELTYEEKLNIDNERYAALQIQHAAENMKAKEQERKEKENIEHKRAIARLKDERQDRVFAKEQELENARKGVKTMVVAKSDVNEVQEMIVDTTNYSTPTERRIAQVYAGWIKPALLEDSYPELKPAEFAPNQVPGVKCFVKVSETSAKGDQVVKEIAPQFFEDEEVIVEIATIHALLKQRISVNHIWSMFKAGEFKKLQQPSIQTALVKICEYIGHQRNVSSVLAAETQEQAKTHPVGLKALLRMVTHAKDIKTEEFFKEVIPKEMGKWSATTQELQTVSQMIKQGCKSKEIIASCEAGKLPTLKKPETQQPLINLVEKQGHTVMVAQVLVEEAYADAKEDRLMAGEAWKSVHTEELTEAQVIEINSITSELQEKKKIIIQTTKQLEEKIALEKAETLKIAALEISKVEAKKEVGIKMKKAKITQVHSAFSTELVPGVKAYIKMVQEKKIDVVEAVGKTDMKEAVKKEMMKVASLIQHGTVDEDVFTMIEAGEFPELLRSETQAELIHVVEHFGFAIIANEVMIEQAVQESSQAVGIKSYVRMSQKEIKNIEKITNSTIEQQIDSNKEEMAKELTQIAFMLSQGIETNEIISLVEAGKLPLLSKPEAQAPLIQMVQSQGHSAIVCETLVEESVKKLAQDLPKVDVATISSQKIVLKKASKTQVLVQEELQVQEAQLLLVEETIEIAGPLDVKLGDQLRAIATYIVEDEHENAMHLVEGEKVYVQECSNNDWWFVEKHLTKERGYVPAKLLAVEKNYNLYVQKRLEEKITKLPIFDKLSVGDTAVAPKIFKKLEPQVVIDGCEVQFSCQVEGNPRPTITWFRQTAIIKPSEEFQTFYSADNIATLVIKEVFPEDAGMFSCVAKNQAGTAACSAELVVEGPMSDHGSEGINTSRRSLSRESSVCDILEGIPPTFAQKPMTKTTEEGVMIELEVRLVAIPEPEIVWRFNGQIVKDSERIKIIRQKDVHAYRSILIIKKTKKDDTGIYEIYVTNKEGDAKNSIKLNVTAPKAPQFIEKLHDTRVEEEGTIRLVARVRGNPVPDVSWSRNGQKLKAEPNVIMTYQDDLVVLEISNALHQRDDGKYMCTAINKMGKSTDYCQVLVGRESVTFKKGLESCVVEEHSEVTLECRTSKEIECTWMKNNHEIKVNETVQIEKEGLTHRLILSSARVSDAGKYECIFQKTSTWCNLTVKGSEEFIRKLEDVEVMEKEEAVLIVELSSDNASVTWHKEGEEISDKRRFRSITEGKIRKLILTSATLSDEGEYTCVMGDLECSCELGVRELPAEIDRKMKDILVYKGNKATFEVELTKGDAVITWYKNDEEIRFSEHYQLSIDGKVQRLMVYNCQMDDGGFYRAVVGKSECSAVLTVELQPEGEFDKKLQTQIDVISGSEVTFTAIITKADYDVTWRINGEQIIESDRYIVGRDGNKRSLTIKSAMMSDTAEYTCILGKLKSSSALNVLVLESAPTVEMSSIQSEYVVKKSVDVTFSIAFKAEPLPTATWTHKGKPIAASNKYLSTITENNASITIKQVENIDCGEYKLNLENHCGNVSIDITLKILDKPSKPGWPEILQITNESVSIHWRAPDEDGGRSISNYLVEYKSKSNEAWISFNETIIISETTTVVTQLTTNEEYCFRVTAVNDVGKSEPSEESLYVKVCEPIKPEAPTVLEQLQPVITGLHKTVVLRCVVSGIPLPEIEWMKDDQIVKTNTIYENFTATLTIKETSGSSAGVYRCKASNEAGFNECSASVVIQESPKFEFDESLQCQRLYIGDRWSIPIQVTGYPQPRITWMRNDQLLESSQRIVIHTEEQEGMTNIAVQKLEMDDSAVFSVTAENSAGKATISFNLRVCEEEKIVEEEIIIKEKEDVKLERPGPPVGPIGMTDVSSTTMNLSWNKSSSDGGAEITSYYIEKLEKGQKQWQKVDEVGANIFTYTVQNLNEGREYFFRVFALNSIGLSDALEASETIITKSPFEVPGPPIGPFEVSNLSDNVLLIHWEEPELDGGTPITGYLLERREAFKKAWQRIGQTAAEVTQMDVSGLKRGSTYFFRVFAINEIGQGPPLQPDEPITAGKKITVPSPPTGLNMIDVTSKTVTLGWAPPTTTGGADLIGYVIQSRISVEDKWQKVRTVDPSVTLFCVENLYEKCEYEFRVFAENPVGLSERAAMTEKVQLKTHSTPPSPPTAPLEARPSGPNSLMVEWGAPESDGGAPLLGYIIAIRDIKRTMWIEVGQVDANYTRLHIKELQENHEYNVRVFARNEVGTSDPLETEETVQIIRPDDFQELPADDAAPSLSYSTTETLSWMREAGVDADIYSYARGRLLNRDEYFFKVWHEQQKSFREDQ